jgi:hypothetical protein
MWHSLFAITLTALISAAALALACSQPDLGPEVYCGTYRGGPKTSFYKTAAGRLEGIAELSPPLIGADPAKLPRMAA